MYCAATGYPALARVHGGCFSAHPIKNHPIDQDHLLIIEVRQVAMVGAASGGYAAASEVVADA